MRPWLPRFWSSFISNKGSEVLQYPEIFHSNVKRYELTLLSIKKRLAIYLNVACFPGENRPTANNSLWIRAHWRHLVISSLIQIDHMIWLSMICQEVIKQIGSKRQTYLISYGHVLRQPGCHKVCNFCKKNDSLKLQTTRWRYFSSITVIQGSIKCDLGHGEINQNLIRLSTAY